MLQLRESRSFLKGLPIPPKGKRRKEKRKRIPESVLHVRRSGAHSPRVPERERQRKREVKRKTNLRSRQFRRRLAMERRRKRRSRINWCSGMERSEDEKKILRRP